MTIREIIDSLEDQARDKERLAGGDPDSIFTYDADVLMEAAISAIEDALDTVRGLEG